MATGDMDERLPIRCRAEEVAEQLLLVVRGLPFLADRIWGELCWGRIRIELLTLWRVELLLEPCGAATCGKATMTSGSSSEVVLSKVTWSDTPDGRCWVYGCQRDDWTLGPASRVVEPLQFLSAEERTAMEVLLRGARCWPEPISAEPQAPAVLLEERIRPKRRRQRQARRSLAEIP
jgi:hypothetical protein